MTETIFTVRPEQLPSLDGVAEDSMRVHGVRGLALNVLHQGEPAMTRCFGLADPACGRAVEPFTHFEAASLTKPLFAYAVLKLADRGLFDLDRPLATYPVVPPTNDERIRLLTARHVLTHASGLPNWGKKPLPMLFSPGNGFHYSGEGYAYLQRVIEQVTDRRLDRLLQEEAFDPFGMDDAAMLWTGPLNRTLAVSHGEDGMPEPIRKSVWHRIGYYEPNAAFSLYVNIRDYMKFLRNAVTPDFTRRVLETMNPAGENVSWGLGFGQFRGALWHWGDNGGYKSFFCVNAAAGDAIVIHTNSFSGLAACRDIVEHISCSSFSDVFRFIDSAEE